MEDKNVGKKEVPLPHRRAWKKRVIAVSVAVGIGLLSFLMGFFTRQWTLDEELQALMDVKKGIQSTYYKEVTDEAFYDVIFDAVNNDLLDKYSQYMNKAEASESRAHGKGKYEGLGLSFHAESEDAESLKIVRVSGNSPAENAGVRLGDYVVGIGDSVENMTRLTSYAQFREILDGYAGGQNFTLFTCPTYAGEDITSYLLCKSEYVENYVYYRSQTGGYRFTGTADAVASVYDNALHCLPADMAYIQLTQFNGNANKAFDSAMSIFKAEGKKHLVLDLRGNGGGYMYIMQDIAKYFCKTAENNHPVVAFAQYEKKKEAYTATGNVYERYFTGDSQIYVLADAASASAAECLLGAMLDYGAVDYAHICLSKRGKDYKTFGKGIMQVTFSLSAVRGDALKLTTAYVLWPSGNCIHERGILATDGTKTVEENYEKDVEIVEALKQFTA